MRRRFLIVAAIVFFLGLIFLSNSISNIPQNSQPKSQNASHFLDSKDARVHVIGYFDLEATESRDAWERLAQLREQYGDRISLEFRHYPVTAIHRHAMVAALAAEAAGEQGKFWEFLDMLWGQQDAWRSVPSPQPLFDQYAEQVGVDDISRFREDVNRQRFKDRIFIDLDTANNARISLDAPFFVADQLVSMSGLQLATERILSKPD